MTPTSSIPSILYAYQRTRGSISVTEFDMKPMKLYDWCYVTFLNRTITAASSDMTENPKTSYFE